VKEILHILKKFRKKLGRLNNKYECTMDQDLYTYLLAGSRRMLLHMQPRPMHRAPRGRCVCCQQTTTFFSVKWRPGRLLESMKSSRKSDSFTRCVISWRTILTEFHSDPIWNNGALSFLWRVSSQVQQEQQQQQKQQDLPKIYKTSCSSSNE